jgi:penicillin-binding protein 2
LDDALKYSCNIFFYHAGLETGEAKIVRMARQLGMGESTGMVLPWESAGLVPSSQWKRQRGLGAWTKGDTVNLSIGQGYLLVTPLQVAVLGACLGSDGIWRSPSMVRRLTGAGSEDDPRLVPFAREINVAKENLQCLKLGMMKVVNDKDATGYSAHLDNVQVAGKTGTVQTVSDRANKKDHAWFMGYAPAQNPRVALAVGGEGAGTGGLAAAPIAREVFTAYFTQGVSRQ